MYLLQNIKTWICTSEPIPVCLAKQFFNYFSFGSYKLCNMYGATETLDVTFHVITNEDDLCVNDKVPIGEYINFKVSYNTSLFV